MDGSDDVSRRGKGVKKKVKVERVCVHSSRATSIIPHPIVLPWCVDGTSVLLYVHISMGHAASGGTLIVRACGVGAHGARPRGRAGASARLCVYARLRGGGVC